MRFVILMLGTFLLLCGGACADPLYLSFGGTTVRFEHGLWHWREGEIVSDSAAFAYTAAGRMPNGTTVRGAPAGLLQVNAPASRARAEIGNVGYVQYVDTGNLEFPKAHAEASTHLTANGGLALFSLGGSHAAMSVVYSPELEPTPANVVLVQFAVQMPSW